MSPPVRLGLCGAGWVVGHCYAPALEACGEQFAVTTIFEPERGRWPSIRALFPQAEIVLTRDDLLTRSLDAVVVASPNACHLADAEAALESGIACLVEKPVLRNTADLGRLRRAASRGDAALFASAACRYRADARSWLEYCHQIGPLRRLDLVWHREKGVPGRDWHRAASAGWTGVLADLGPHLLDLAGAALDWRSGDVAIRRRNAAVPEIAPTAVWYGGAATCEIAVCDQFSAEMMLGDCRLVLSFRWRDEGPGDLVRLEAEGDDGACCLEGLFGFSGERRLPHQRLRARLGSVDTLQDFETGPAPQVAGFAAMLADFAARSRKGWAEDPGLAFLARLGDALAAEA
jgi:predicted dehydrogenase